MRRGLKSDGHGNGGTLINGNGGTHYESIVYIQATIVIIYQLFALINIFWQQWNTFLVVSKVFFKI